jgi:phage replication-related protein YjqB (UPF0714/DUF867 family)
VPQVAAPSTCQPGGVDLKKLLDIPGVEEECVLRSPVGFMALHGGSQDRGTDHIARRAAEASGASFYAILQPDRLRLHLTSRRHDPDHSATMRGFLAHIRIAISIHGFGREGFALWIDPSVGLVIDPYGPAVRDGQTAPLTGIIVGGLNAPLLAAARTLLGDRFAGYHVADERLRLGFHPQNPVNLPTDHGIQIELPPGLRGIGAYGERLLPHYDELTSDLIAALAELAGMAARIVAEPGGAPGAAPDSAPPSDSRPGRLRPE